QKQIDRNREKKGHDKYLKKNNQSFLYRIVISSNKKIKTCGNAGHQHREKQIREYVDNSSQCIIFFYAFSLPEYSAGRGILLPFGAQSDNLFPSIIQPIYHPDKVFAYLLHR